MSAVETRTPRRRSAVEGRHVELGARLVERDGWWQPEVYASPEAEIEAVLRGAGLFDLSPLGKLDVRALDPSAAWRMIAPGEETPAGPRICRLTLSGQDVLAAGLNPERIFLTGAPGSGAAVERAIREAASGACVSVNDVTSGFTAIELAGPKGASILRKLCPVPPPAEDRLAVQARVGGVHAIVLRVDGAPQASAHGAPAEGLPAFRLHVSRDLGLYLWEALEDAGKEFGLIPYGRAARSRLFPNVFPG
ncbi:MAG: hypothetical protein ACE5IM_10655 [Nitrospinota bacterium]